MEWSESALSFGCRLGSARSRDDGDSLLVPLPRTATRQLLALLAGTYGVIDEGEPVTVKPQMSGPSGTLMFGK